MRLTDSLITWLEDNGHCAKDAVASDYKQKTAALLLSGELTGDKFAELSTTEDDIRADRLRHKGNKMSKADQLFAGREGNGTGTIRVKRAQSQYSEKTYTAKNRFGQVVLDPIYGGECHTQSELSKAMSGVLFKYTAARAGIADVVLSEHEKELLADMCDRHEWCGTVNGQDVVDFKGAKAVLEDSLSGGLNVVPVWFDEDLLTFPLLHSELWPLIDIKEAPRPFVTSGSVGNPSVSWGNSEGTAMPLFTTDALIAQLTATCFPVTCAIEVGRDQLADSPAALGETLSQNLGESFSKEFDKVIGSGNGTTQPTGIFNASGVTTINPSAGLTGPPTLADYMNLLFSVGKQYRTAANNLCFVSNDQSFQRSRAIRIDPQSSTTDQRAVLDPLMSNQGSFVNQYSTLGWPHKVQNDISNSKCAIVALKKYRMYRRTGISMEWFREGATLGRANTVLLIARSRIGGGLRDSSAMAKWISGQS